MTDVLNKLAAVLEAPPGGAACPDLARLESLVLSGKWPRACVNPSILEKSSLVRWQPFSMERGPGN